MATIEMHEPDEVEKNVSIEFRDAEGSKETTPKKPSKGIHTEKNHHALTRPSGELTVHLPTPPPTPMPVARPLPLLICSIGNPGSTYANTLHSAGHTILNRLAETLGYPKFQKGRSLGDGLVSRASTTGEGGDWTLWQSTSYMNESGKGVRAAWMAWSRNIQDGEGKLVVIHDELEKPLGSVTMRAGQGASAKGHNGLKSILSVIGNTPFTRVSVGIGRPESRQSDDVARYVLNKMTPAEKAKIEGSVDEIVAKLKQLERG